MAISIAAAMPLQLTLIQALIIDMDGVLWRGRQPLPGVADFFDLLSENSIRFLLATNNATATRESYVERLSAMGIAVKREQVLTSSAATAQWLQDQLPRGSRVLVVGEEGLVRALTTVGFEVINDPHANGREPVAAVLVGLDRKFTYDKLRAASRAIRAGARFIATNADLTYPAEEGLVPGAGSLVAAIRAASSVTPTIIGKPYRPMFDAALELLQTPPAQTAMLGDRLDTDIEGAHNAGLKTILVLTGVSTAEEAQAAEIKPDLVCNDLVELRQRWLANLIQA